MKKEWFDVSNVLGSQEKIYFRMKGLNPQKYVQTKKTTPLITNRRSTMLAKLQELKLKRTMKKG